MAGGGCVDDHEAIFKRGLTGEEAQPLEHQKGLEPGQRGGDVAEGAAFEHPARDRAHRYDARDEGFEFAARGDRDEVEGGAGMRPRIGAEGGIDQTAPTIGAGRDRRGWLRGGRQGDRDRGGDGTLAGPALAGNED